MISDDFKDLSEHEKLSFIREGMDLMFRTITEGNLSVSEVNNLFAKIIGVYEPLIARLILYPDQEQRYDIVLRSLASLSSSILMDLKGEQADYVEQTGMVIDLNSIKEKCTIH